MEEYTDTFDAQELRRARRSFSTLGFGAVAILAITVGLQFAAAFVISGTAPEIYSNNIFRLMLSFIPIYCVGMPVGIFIMRKVPAVQCERESFGVGAVIKIFLICIFMMYSGSIVGAIVNAAIGNALGRQIVNPVESLAMMDVPLAIRILITVIIGPFMEELVFRKVLISRMRVYGERLAIVSSALIFGLFHGNLSQFFYAAALGLVFGYVYLRSDSIWYSFGMHAAVNFIGGIVSAEMIKRSGISSMLSDGAAGLAPDPGSVMEAIGPGMFLWVGFMLLLIVLWVLGLAMLCGNAHKARFCRAEQQLPKGTAFSVSWLNAGMIILTIGCIAMMVYTILR